MWCLGSAVPELYVCLYAPAPPTTARFRFRLDDPTLPGVGFWLTLFATLPPRLLENSFTTVKNANDERKIEGLLS